MSAIVGWAAKSRPPCAVIRRLFTIHSPIRLRDIGDSRRYVLPSSTTTTGCCCCCCDDVMHKLWEPAVRHNDSRTANSSSSSSSRVQALSTRYICRSMRALNYCRTSFMPEFMKKTALQICITNDKIGTLIHLFIFKATCVKVIYHILLSKCVYVLLPCGGKSFPDIIV